jgi:hypothetical protein
MLKRKKQVRMSGSQQRQESGAAVAGSDINFRIMK